MSVSYIIGFVQSLFFITLILTKREKQLKDYLLSAYLLILGLNLIFIYWNNTGFHESNPIVIILDFAYWTLLGPLLYIYVDIVSKEKAKLRWSYLLHLMPLLFVLVAFSEYWIHGFNNSFFYYESNSYLFYAGYIVWMYNSIVYYILIIFKLKFHKKKVKSYFSTIDNVDLKWLNYLVHGFAFFLFFLLFSGNIFKLLNLDYRINSFHFTWLVMVIYIFGIGFFGYKQKGIFSDLETLASVKERDTNQYKKSGLREEEADLIKDSLEELMKKEKPYIEYDLTLPKLADKLNTTSHKLSQVINEKYNSNFFEFINRHRLEDIKQLLQDENNADTKIMALAYDCGFNSKSAFYSFFKKETTLTPTEYRNRHLVSAEL